MSPSVQLLCNNNMQQLLVQQEKINNKRNKKKMRDRAKEHGFGYGVSLLPSQRVPDSSINLQQSTKYYLGFRDERQNFRGNARMYCRGTREVLCLLPQPTVMSTPSLQPFKSQKEKGRGERKCAQLARSHLHYYYFFFNFFFSCPSSLLSQHRHNIAPLRRAL